MIESELSLFQLLVLAIVQGVTEFLPISSSAHLILTSRLAGWPDQGLTIDVATHLGTLLAICTYFRHDLARLATRATHQDGAIERRLIVMLAAATTPALAVGLALAPLVETTLRDPMIIAATTLFFGLLLGWSDRRRDKHAIVTEYQLSWRQAMFIGVAQAFAVVPGTSRSGITMTAGLALGLNRTTSARFSFLLSIPILAAAGSCGGLKIFLSASHVAWSEFVIAAVLSALFALTTVHLFRQWLDRLGMLPFVIYRVLLSIVLLVLFV